MADYKPNSHKFKNEEKTTEKKPAKVISGKAKTRKKSELQKMTGAIISEDARNVKSYILMDVLLPAVKDAIEDIVTNGIRMILRGETGARRSSSNSGLSKISYNNAYKTNNRSYYGEPTRSGYSYDDIVLDSRGDVENVIRHMDDLISQYGSVSVAYLYDLVGILVTPNDNKWGWSNIRNAEPIRVKEGYLLKLPKAHPID